MATKKRKKRKKRVVIADPKTRDMIVDEYLAVSGMQARADVCARYDLAEGTVRGWDRRQRLEHGVGLLRPHERSRRQTYASGSVRKPSRGTLEVLREASSDTAADASVPQLLQGLYDVIRKHAERSVREQLLRDLTDDKPAE